MCASCKKLQIDKNGTLTFPSSLLPSGFQPISSKLQAGLLHTTFSFLSLIFFVSMLVRRNFLSSTPRGTRKDARVLPRVAIFLHDAQSACCLHESRPPQHGIFYVRCELHALWRVCFPVVVIVVWPDSDPRHGGDPPPRLTQRHHTRPHHRTRQSEDGDIARK